MAYYYLYRKNGGQVLGISVSSSTWSDSTYFSVYESAEHKDLTVPQWSDGTTIRNATEGEIANFATAEAEDLVSTEQGKAKEVVDANAAFKGANSRTLRALVELIVDELNILRALHSLPNRTLTQVKTALKNKIDTED